MDSSVPASTLRILRNIGALLDEASFPGKFAEAAFEAQILIRKMVAEAELATVTANEKAPNEQVSKDV